MPFSPETGLGWRCSVGCLHSGPPRHPNGQWVPGSDGEMEVRGGGRHLCGASTGDSFQSVVPRPAASVTPGALDTQVLSPNTGARRHTLSAGPAIRRNGLPRGSGAGGSWVTASGGHMLRGRRVCAVCLDATRLLPDEAVGRSWMETHISILVR